MINGEKCIILSGNNGIKWKKQWCFLYIGKISKKGDRNARFLSSKMSITNENMQKNFLFLNEN
jgi:hypothetical protein